jgi:hypothetical protein
MKAVSKFAIALALGSLSLTASVAVSAADEKPKKEKKAKKGKEADGPAELKLALSKEFTAVYQPVINEYIKARGPEPATNAPQAAKTAFDAASASAATAATPSWGAIKAAVLNEDDRYQAGVFGFQIGRETKNKPLQLEAADMILASTTTPAAQIPIYTYQKGAIAYEASDWANAELYMTKAHGLGYKNLSTPGGIEMLIADALNAQKKYPESLAWMEKSLAASKVPGTQALPTNFYPRAANVALRSKDRALITRWMSELVRSDPKPDYWHDAIMQTYAAGGLDTQEELDLMRLLRSVGGMKYEQNYSAYATDALIAFFPTEMKAVLDEGFAKGTISKTNATFGGRYSDVMEKLKLEPYSTAVLDQDIASAKTGAQAAFAGDIALSVGEYARAKGAYEAAIAKGSIVDKDGKDLMERTVMRLGMAKLKLGDAAGAKAEFAKVTSATRKAVADYWAIYADQMAKAPPAAA